MKKRLFASFLSLCVAMTLLPTVVFASASDKAIVPGTSGITGYDAKNSYDYIYYGQWEDAPLKWRVLDDQTNTGEEGLFVLSEDCLGTGNWGDIVFDDTSPVSNAWQGSDAQTWCNTLLTNNFTPGEQGAVLDTTKSDEAYDSAQESFSASENILNGDKLFFLSAQEAETASYGFVDDASRVAKYQTLRNGQWWLRSPQRSGTQDAGLVQGAGWITYRYVGSDSMARPAFNLDVDSVLFTSAAVGGKVSQGAISPIAAYTGSEWKLTLLDQIRSNFAAETTAKNGNTLTVSYRNAATGANEYLSVLVADDSGAYTHYGRILQLDGTTHGASGTVDVALTGIDLTGKTVYLFNEQYNGGAQDDTKRTDYASPLIALSTADVYDLSVCGTQVTSDNASDVLGNGAVSYDSATRTLTLNNATLNPGADATAISVGEFAQGFTIRLQGTNTITSNGLAVDSASSLIIQGTQEGSQSIHCQFCDATKVDAKAPTCTEAGNREYWYCEVCGAVLEQGKAIAKVAHHYENGVCTACGAADPNAPKPTPTPTPTPTPAPKPTQTPNPDQPQTGDANQVVVWMVVLTLSGCMAAGLALLSQRKRS